MSVASETAIGRPGLLPAQYARILVYVFFFVSGVPALVYQLAWQRVLFRIFGVSMDSVTIVVTAFMLGLGIGSLIGSWLSERREAPLLLVAAIEVSIGLFGLCSLALFQGVDPLVQNMSLTGRGLVAMALVFVPTMLMGATMPLLIGHMVRQSANVGFSAGSLYRVNALGAVAGCALCALLLFPFLGLQASVAVAAALNFAVAGIAAAAHRLQRGEERIAAGTAMAPSPVLAYPAALALVLFSGFVSLSFEIFFLHLSAFASGTNAVIFAMTLGAFLLGIASGAQDAAEWSKSGRTDLPASLCVLLLANGLAGLAVLPLVARSGPLGNGLVAIIALAAFVVARSLGAIFPIAAHLAVPADGAAGRRAGLLYLANILGSAAGSLLTGFVLCDLVGIRALALLLSGLGLAAALLLIVLSRSTSALAPRATVLLLLAAAGLALFQYPLTRSVLEAMLYKQEASRHPPLVQVIENRNGIVAAGADGTVYGGGVYDGHFNIDPMHDINGIIRAYGLSLFHPAPHDVFMVGLASGSWAQVIAANPDVRHLTIVEINPGYAPMVRERPEVASLLTNPKVELVIDDANRWLKRHPGRRFDAIIANATYHFRANASNLLSTGFDRMVAGHLKPGGIYMFNTTESARALHTGCASFPHGYRFFNNVVLGAAPIAVDGERWRKILTGYRIDGRPAFDLNRAADRALLAHDMAIPGYASYLSADPAAQPLEDCRSVLARTEGRVSITDDNMGTEWRYPLGLD